MSFLKEGGRSSRSLGCVDLSFAVSAWFWARRVRPVSGGRAEGRPRGGRRPWSQPDDHSGVTRNGDPLLHAIKCSAACSCGGDLAVLVGIKVVSAGPGPARDRAGLHLDAGCAPAGSAPIRSWPGSEHLLVAGGGFRVGAGPGVAYPKSRRFGASTFAALGRTRTCDARLRRANVRPSMLG